MTAWLQNTTKAFKRDDFRLRILGNKSVLGKAQIGWTEMLVPSLPSYNKVLVIVVKNYTKVDFKFC